MMISVSAGRISGTVGHAHEDQLLVARSAPESMAADQYRVLLRRLDRVSSARPLRTIAVSSCARGEGRSVVAANLAITAARAGREVALLEADLKRPCLARLFDFFPHPGVSELVEGKVELSGALARIANVAMLCAGDVKDAATVVRSPRLAAVLEALRASFPLVVVDAPPALALADAGRLGSFADGIVLVVRAGTTPRDAVRMAAEALSERLIGIVLNGVEEPGYARYLREDALSA